MRGELEFKGMNRSAKVTPASVPGAASPSRRICDSAPEDHFQTALSLLPLTAEVDWENSVKKATSPAGSRTGGMGRLNPSKRTPGIPGTGSFSATAIASASDLPVQMALVLRVELPDQDARNSTCPVAFMATLSSNPVK